MIRLLLRLLPLGDRRQEVESDLLELFEARRQTRGRLYAYWRLLRDLGSVLPPRASRKRGGIRSWLLDMRYGLRLFRKHPAVIGATVVGLALAIAVGTTVFTILNASLIRSYGMANPESVVRVQLRVDAGISTEWPYNGFAGMRERAQQSQLAASFQDGVRFAMSPAETSGRIDAVLLVSGNYLPLLGAQAVIGRTLQPSDDEPGAAPVVVVNHRFWMLRMNGDRSVVGKTIWLSGTPVTLAGVIDQSFTGPVDKPPAFWAPFGSYGSIYRDRPMSRTSAAQVRVVARLADGVARTTAEQELSAIAVGLPDVGLRVESGTIPVTGARLDGAGSPLDAPDSAGLLIVIAVILLIVGLVLALACANVANLLLAGAAARAREIGVRLALGASRRRILRQLLNESLLIGLMAGAVGLLLSLWTVPVVTRAIGLPETYDVKPDLAVILFTTAIGVLSGIAAGLAPARHGSRGDLLGVLKSQSAQAGSSPKATRTRRLFIGFQAAASILLLVTAALFLRAAVHMVRIDLGFDADRLAAVAPSFPRSGFDPRAVETYWRSALEKVRAMPAVERASLALYPPFGGAVSLREVPGMARRGLAYRIYENRTDAEYFATAGFRLVRGRAYSVDDVRTNAPVAVVSESIVRDFFGAEEPIGASLSAVSDQWSSLRIIGVVGEALTAHVMGPGNGTIYRPLSPSNSDLGAARLVVRAENPSAIVRDLEQVLLTADARVRPSTTLVVTGIERYMDELKVLAGMSGAVALLALVLAVLGLYGVTTFVVGQRMWEMHVRQAIGASGRDIVRLLVRQSLTPVMIGLTVGLAIALAAVRVLTPALSGINPYDPAAIGGAVIVLFGAAIAAVISPALRAANADPAAVLRQ
jgi:predicted permease